MGKPWTHHETELLLRFLTERQSDAWIAAVMNRPPRTIGRHRQRLGCAKPFGKPGGRGGWKHTPQARAKIGQANRKRWQNPDYRAARLAEIAVNFPKARQKYQKSRFRLPPHGTSERRLYHKLQSELGSAVARTELAQLLTNYASRPK